jgi:hypothetical protein
MRTCRSQVDRGFDDEDGEIVEVARPTKRAKTVPSAVVDQQKQRQRAFLRRHVPGADPSSWRPIKIYRRTAKNWCVAVDTQFQVSIDDRGLQFFQRSDKLDIWRDWRLWPHVGLSIDLGSSGLCGYQALERKFGLNCDLYPDGNHGASCDLRISLSQNQLYGMWLCLVISYNLTFGSDKDEQRFLQIRQAMEACFRDRRPCDVPLFLSFCQGILEDLQRMGVELPGVKSAEDEAWDWMKGRGFCVREGRRVTMCRFLASVEGAMKHVPKWHIDGFERLWTALELDMLRGKKLQTIIVKTSEAEAGGEHMGSTSGTRIGMEDKTFKGCFDNALITSVAMLLDESNLRINESILAPTRHLKIWQGSQSKAIRSCLAAETWLVGQVTGDYMAHVDAIVGTLKSAVDMERCRFVVRAHVADRLDPKEVVTEDEHADIMGQFVMTLAANRMRRGLWFFGWPTRMFRVLKGGELALQTVVDFLWDCEHWVIFADLEDKSNAQLLLQNRSVFKKVSVIQLMAALKDTAGVITDDFLELLHNRARGLFGTQIAEDLIGAQKNNKDVKTGRKFRRPEYSMAAGIKGKVLEERHHFIAPNMDTPMQAKTVRLDASCFSIRKEGRSLPFHTMVSTSQTPDFYSPSAQNLNTPHADVVLVSVSTTEN